MRFPSPLRAGRLIKRYKRFLADVAFEDGTEVTAHCANPGSMMGLSTPGMPVWLSRSESKTRKLPFSLELVEVDGVLTAINTGNPNKLAEEALRRGAIPELAGYADLARERKYGENSRIDILLSDPAHAQRRRPDCYVEIKNVHLVREPGLAEFPDSVTTRGAKHLAELTRVVAAGGRAVMLYIVQRGDCRRLRPAADLDPAYADALIKATDAGVETLCYDCDVTTEEIVVRRALPVDVGAR
ncbi:MAG: DNA/RNA nuclease SfsA [Pseudomonadota bacterium]